MQILFVRFVAVADIVIVVVVDVVVVWGIRE